MRNNHAKEGLNLTKKRKNLYEMFILKNMRLYESQSRKVISEWNHFITRENNFTYIQIEEGFQAVFKFSKIYYDKT